MDIRLLLWLSEVCGQAGTFCFDLAQALKRQRAPQPQDVGSVEVKNSLPNEKRDILWVCDSCAYRATMADMELHFKQTGHPEASTAGAAKRDTALPSVWWHCESCRFGSNDRSIVDIHAEKFGHRGYRLDIQGNRPDGLKDGTIVRV